MRVQHVDACPMCGDVGTALHDGLSDRLFAAPGLWAMARCHSCRAVWLTPRPVDADLSIAYSSYYTHDAPHGAAESPSCPSFVDRLHEAELGVARRKYRPPDGPLEGSRLLRALVSVWPGRRADACYLAANIAVRPGERLLDIGCGDGLLLDHLRKLGWSVEGVEPDGRAAATARRRGLSVTTATVEAARFPAGHFSAVIMSHVVEHLSDPEATLREVRRVLAPNGVLVVITPNADSILHRWFGRNWLLLDPPRHLVLQCPTSMAQLLARAGFSADVHDSWRAANLTIAASRTFQRGGRYSLQAAPSPRARVVAELGQQALYLLGPLVRGRADELVAVARPAAS